MLSPMKKEWLKTHVGAALFSHASGNGDDFSGVMLPGGGAREHLCKD